MLTAFHDVSFSSIHGRWWLLELKISCANPMFHITAVVRNLKLTQEIATPAAAFPKYAGYVLHDKTD